MKKLNLKWKKLHPSAQIPKVQTQGAACFDLVAASDEAVLVEFGKVTLIPTGLSVEIPEGFEMQVRARSGLAAKQGFTLVNGIGTIDSDYRGEIKVIATSIKENTVIKIRNGDRIAQACLAPTYLVEHEEVEELSSTERGEGGFGSTGVSKGQSPQEII